MSRRLLLLVLLSSPIASARADEAESAAEAERLSLDATHGIAPQPEGVEDLYRRARPIRGDRFDGMWVCEASVTGDDWDGADPNGPVRRYMGRVELDADVGLPGRDDVVRFRGPDDTNRVTFAVAGVAIESGQSMSVALSDRDMLSNTAIARFDLVYDGSMPVRARAERASIECRGVPESALRSKIDDAIEAADEALDDLEENEEPDAAIVGFRDEDADPVGAALAIFAIARLTGLADPRFLSRRDTLRTREAAYIADVASLVRDVVTAAPPLGTERMLPGTSLGLTVETVDCAAEDVIELHAAIGLDVEMECAIRLRVRNTGRATTLSFAMHLVDDLGATVLVDRFGIEVDGRLERATRLRIAPGTTSVVVASPSRHATALRLSRRRSVAWFSLVATPPESPRDPRRIDLRGRPRHDRAGSEAPEDTSP